MICDPCFLLYYIYTESKAMFGRIAEKLAANSKDSCSLIENDFLSK